MSKFAVATKSTIIPCLRYRDALAAIDWLCEVFGFEKQAVYTNPDGSVAHAQLTLGGGMLMIGSVVADSEWGKLIRQPDDIGGDETQSPYLVVADADQVYERALKRDAEIVIDIKFEDYGGRGFSCRDLEGRLWSVGTYDPWQ
ncbi:VOC family protein [Herminiimonas contaminans]|uniref:VOC family protein n=1 Tax=Herminiimonas contaminans TaxID=1111140 RepID=A0ABS0EVM0_9BURK|nr:VOC family protein [Herminiimonas contaminans]MBF8178139.1 VOC family protein [Herminiimonas contaminans]